MGGTSNSAGYLPLLLGLLVFATPSVCIDPDQYCGDGVQTAVSSFTFNGTEADDFWGNVCTNELGMHSMGAGIKTYCSSSDVGPSWKLLEYYCTENGLSLPSWDDITTVLTDDLIQSFQVVEFEDIDATKIWNHSVLLSRTLYKASYRTTRVFEREYKLHVEYGWAMYGFWGLILLAGMLNHAFTRFSSSKNFGSRDMEAAARDIGATKRPDPVQSAQLWVQKHLTVPPLFGSYHQERLWTCSLPTRLESIVLAAYWIINLILCCVSYEAFYPNLYYTKPIQVWRYLADRTGILSYANLPWLWLFSGRNNIFIPLTGWSFSTFNLFHRHIARVATIQAIVHSVAYTHMEIQSHYLAEEWAEQYWYMGGIATITMSLLLGLSSFWLRRHAYEVFLLIHIAFAILTVIGLFYHTKIFDGEYDGYLWPLVAIWVFDRAARLVRLAYCNLHLLSKRSRESAKASVAYDKDANLLTLEIPLSGKPRPRPAAGQHYYIYQPGTLKFWENHPFTLASWSSLDTVAQSESTAGDNTDRLNTKQLELIGESSSSSPATSSPTASVSNQDSRLSTAPGDALSFLIRPTTKSGFTYRLLQQCLASSSGRTTSQLLVEGPYGTTHPLHAYETLILVAGGSGISATLPYLLEYIAHATSKQSGKPGPHKTWRTRQIIFVWATREPAMLQYIGKQHLRSLLDREDVSWHLHATSKPAMEQVHDMKTASVIGPADRDSNSSRELNEKGDLISTNAAMPGQIQAVVPYALGRPDISAIVREAAHSEAEGGSRGGRVGVFACGPAGMADTARAAALEAMRAPTGKQVEVGYFEEEFGW